MTWSAFHRYSDITGYLDYLANTYPDLCSVQTIGRSHENRPLRVLKYVFLSFFYQQFSNEEILNLIFPFSYQQNLKQ